MAAASIVGGAHPVGLTLRLWLFSAVYLSVARVVLASVRKQALRNQALATPTLILGAGVVGEHLVRRLTSDRSYGLRPVGFLDSDPMPTDGLFTGRRGPGPRRAGEPRWGDPPDRRAPRHPGLLLPSPTRARSARSGNASGSASGCSLVPRMFEAINDRATLDHVGGLPLVFAAPHQPPSAGSSRSSTRSTACSPVRRSWCSARCC